MCVYAYTCGAHVHFVDVAAESVCCLSGMIFGSALK